MSKINCDLINGDLNLSKSDKNYFYQDENKDWHMKFTISKRREPDKNGNDLTMSFQKTKEQREAKAETKYLPAFVKSVTFESQPAQQTGDPFESKADVKFNNDLPF